MELKPNKNKKLEIIVDNNKYNRYPIKTHHIQINENYNEIIERYVLPIYKKDDIITISEKIISLCQKNIIYKKDIKLSFLAKFLAKFAMRTEAGIGVNCPYKMQFAINTCGKLKVIYAAIAAGFGKLFHKSGVFYDIVGKEVSELDGFYGKNFAEYDDFGILIPKNPNGVCNEIFNNTGVRAIIVDANDFSVDILGKSDNIDMDNEVIKEIIKDNPSGQSKQQTPIVLIRKEK